jgi:ubiquinone/menaquinone biosynthesis C-methylase UbiE
MSNRVAVHPAQRRPDALLLELEVGEQVLGERVERGDDACAGRLGVVGAQSADRGLELVELLGDAPVVALEAVDERAEVRVDGSHRREQRGVLEPVVAVHEPAVVQAVHLQRPQRPVGFERAHFGSQLVRRQPLGHARGKAAHRLEVAADHVVHPQQLLEQRLAERMRRIHAGSFLDSLAVERSGTSSAETWDSLFSDFYLRAYASDERDAGAGEQALAAARLAGCPDGGDLLDVPCGFGRHSIPLARAGYRVVGTDRSQALLDEARRRAGGERWPKLVQADYRKLPFADASFDAALNLYTSIGFLGDEEDTKALAEIGRVLRPGAPLVIETMHRDRLVTLGSDRHWELLGEGRLLVAQTAFDHASGVAQTTQTLIDASNERESRTWSIRVYSATELVAMLDSAGFAEAKCYGDLDGGPLGSATRLVVVARTGAPDA